MSTGIEGAPFDDRGGGWQRELDGGGTMGEPKKAGRRRGILSALADGFRSQLEKKIPGLGKLLSKLPPGVRLSLLVAIPIVIGFWTSQDFLEALVQQMNAPRVVIGLLPLSEDLKLFGRPDPLLEFRFDGPKMAVMVGATQDVGKAAAKREPIPVFPAACPGSSAAISPTLYLLPIMVQNVGHRTANKYEVTIAFSVPWQPDRPEPKRLDPGVRIVGVEGDGFDLTYLYQHNQGDALPSCLGETGEEADPAVALQKPVSELTANELRSLLVSSLRAGNEKKPFSPTAPLVRSTYEQFKLTRDVATVEGTLPATLFQVIDVLVRIPSDVEQFVVIYNVNCTDCRFFYRTQSYGQLACVGNKKRTGCRDNPVPATT